MQRNLFFLVFAILFGCAYPDEGIRTDWTSLSLPGKALELIDDKESEWFPFSKEGTSSATIGTKNGPVAAPIFYWRINGNTLQISVFPDAEIFEELRNPAIKGNIISATRKSGVRARYTLSTI